jgi:hypothetical protein
LNITEVQQVLTIHMFILGYKKNWIDKKKVCVVWEARGVGETRAENFVLLNPQYDTEAAMGELLNNWTKQGLKWELLLRI